MRGMEAPTLLRNVGTVALYTLLQLVSLAALSTTLRRKTGIPALVLLAFVLEHQMHFVQCKLALWFVITAQASLLQNGTDFTFRFSWL